VKNLIPDPVDWEEPERLAKTIQTLGLKHCVITSVTREICLRGGALFWAVNNRKIKSEQAIDRSSDPDFNASANCSANHRCQAEVITHNLKQFAG
jgi:lipoic acid synthetase